MNLINNTISIVIPFFNEEKTLEQAFNNIYELKFADQIILVNDGSTDNSLKIANNLTRNNSNVDLISVSENSGKGNAIQVALKQVRCNVVGIFDADLEYSASDLLALYGILKDQNFDFILGSRFIGKRQRRNIYSRTYFANKFLSWLFSVVHKNKITDIATCLKIFRIKILENVNLENQDFSIEVELVSKLLKNTNNYCEIPISYTGRTYSEGKKIKFIDGFKYIYAIFKFSI